MDMGFWVDEATSGLVTYEVALAIPFIDQVAGIPPARITKGEPRPFHIITLILLHQASEVLDIDIV